MAGLHLDRHPSTPPPPPPFWPPQPPPQPGRSVSSPHSWSRRQTSHLQERREKAVGTRAGGREGRREKERSHWPREASNLALGTKGGRRRAACWPTLPGRPTRGGGGGVRIHAYSARSHLRQSNNLSRKSPSSLRGASKQMHRGVERDGVQHDKET